MVRALKRLHTMPRWGQPCHGDSRAWVGAEVGPHWEQLSFLHFQARALDSERPLALPSVLRSPSHVEIPGPHQRLPWTRRTSPGNCERCGDGCLLQSASPVTGWTRVSSSAVKSLPELLPTHRERTGTRPWQLPSLLPLFLVRGGAQVCGNPRHFLLGSGAEARSFFQMFVFY